MKRMLKSIQITANHHERIIAVLLSALDKLTLGIDSIEMSNLILLWLSIV